MPHATEGQERPNEGHAPPLAPPASTAQTAAGGRTHLDDGPQTLNPRCTFLDKIVGVGRRNHGEDHGQRRAQAWPIIELVSDESARARSPRCAISRVPSHRESPSSGPKTTGHVPT